MVSSSICSVKEVAESSSPHLTRSVTAFYQDSPNWTADFKARMTPFRDPQVREFVSRALAVRRAN